MNKVPSSPRFTAHEKALLASGVTIGVVVVLIFAKTLGYLYSGSASVLASLVDSLSDAALSVLTWLSIHYSLKPADDDHRQGHGKIEGVSALFQAAVLAGSGVFLALEASRRFLRPEPVDDQLFAIAMMGIAVVASLALSLFQKRILRDAPSLALKADSAHYSTDVFLNGSVMIVLFLSWKGWAPFWADPLCAIIVAFLLCRTALHIAMPAVDMLMDRELPEGQRQRIAAIITAHPEVIGFHDLRTHQSGMRIFVSFDLELDHNLLLWSAHEIARDIENDILKEFPHAEILIHIDPHGDTADSRHTSEVHHA